MALRPEQVFAESVIALRPQRCATAQSPTNQLPALRHSESGANVISDQEVTAMFREACKRAQQFTHPLVTSKLTVGANA